MTAVQRLSTAVNRCKTIFKLVFCINLFHAKYQVPNFKNEWFMAILVFFTAVIFKLAFCINLLHAKYKIPHFKIQWFMAILVFLQLLSAVAAVDSCNYTAIKYVPTLYSFPICICKLYLLVFWCYLHFCKKVPPPSSSSCDKAIYRAGASRPANYNLIYLEGEQTPPAQRHSS